MLQIQHLTITHSKDLRVILKDFSLTLNPGDKAVVIGEEGNGKSTLLKWIFYPEMIDSYAEAEGVCAKAGEMDLLPGDDRQLCRGRGSLCEGR